MTEQALDQIISTVSISAYITHITGPNLHLELLKKCHLPFRTSNGNKKANSQTENIRVATQAEAGNGRYEAKTKTGTFKYGSTS